MDLYGYPCYRFYKKLKDCKKRSNQMYCSLIVPCTSRDMMGISLFYFKNKYMYKNGAVVENAYEIQPRVDLEEYISTFSTINW